MEIDSRVDPELAPALELLPDGPLNLETLAITREFMEKMTADLNAQLPAIEGITQEDRLIPGPEGAPEVRVRIYKPTEQSENLPALFWIHGGGYVLGGLDQDDHNIKLRMKAVDCVTVSVDYRRAPEAPFPRLLKIAIRPSNGSSITPMKSGSTVPASPLVAAAPEVVWQPVWRCLSGIGRK